MNVTAVLRLGMGISAALTMATGCEEARPPVAPTEPVPVASSAPTSPSTTDVGADPNVDLLSVHGEMPAGGGLPDGGLWGTSTVERTSLRQGLVKVNGRLPPEIVMRIGRMNFGRFRVCYEKGGDPTLSGTVTTKFVIQSNGSVKDAKSESSDLKNASVVDCVARQFGNLAFPPPEGGVVTVEYPVLFSPGNAAKQ